MQRGPVSWRGRSLVMMLAPVLHGRGSQALHAQSRESCRLDQKSAYPLGLQGLQVVRQQVHILLQKCSGPAHSALHEVQLVHSSEGAVAGSCGLICTLPLL